MNAIVSTMPKEPYPTPTPPECRESLGLSPAVLAKRDFIKTNNWCPNPTNFNYDKFCDPNSPKTIHYSLIAKAYNTIKDYIPTTLLLKSKRCQKFSMELHFKIETSHRTGSFHERAAIYALLNLTSEQRHQRIVTASAGNWAMALAYQAHLFNLPLSVVLPVTTPLSVVDKCNSYGATVILHGRNLAEATQRAFMLITESQGFYLNGYDHPNVIAGAGSIGIEILEQLPDAEAILVPVGGGGLIAGVASAVKHLKPKTLIYGIETSKSCSFFKAMDNERPYKINSEMGLASSLIVPKAGENAFHTARSLIDKMVCEVNAQVLVDDDWIARAILHLAEEENIIAEGAGAITLGSLLCLPNVLPELNGKKVVCIISGGNLEIVHMVRVFARANTVEGRIVSLTVRVSDYDRRRIFKALESLECNITVCDFEHDWLIEDKLLDSYEDFDEYCDPENPKILKYEDIVEASERIRPHIINTSCRPAFTQRQFGISLHYKLEFMQRSGSFKERGSLNALQQLPLDKKKLGVVIASLGNEGVGLSYHAAKLNVPVIVVMPMIVPIDKLQRCHNFGAKVVIQGSNLMDAQKYARALARDKGLTYINSRDHPHILAGYGSLALEILETTPFLDAIIVPVGSGGLAAAVATVIKHQKPSVLVYGVQPEKMPTFFNSLESEEMITLPTQANLADAITVNSVGCNAFATAKPLLDKMLLVKDDWIARAMLHLSETEKYVVESAGACTLAVVIGNLVPELKMKNVVCVLTGGNCDNIMLSRCLERGLAAEGRLVKFRVGVRSEPMAKANLMKLISNGGYNIHRIFQDNSWTQDDDYFVEMKFVCETKGLDHALELKRTIERAYPCNSVFETEPFNDKRTCPCFVRKQS